jgi:hypothetical protein
MGALGIISIGIIFVCTMLALAKELIMGEKNGKEMEFAI